MSSRGGLRGSLLTYMCPQNVPCRHLIPVCDAAAGLSNYIPQNNHFVVFEAYFEHQQRQQHRTGSRRRWDISEDQQQQQQQQQGEYSRGQQQHQQQQGLHTPGSMGPYHTLSSMKVRKTAGARCGAYPSPFSMLLTRRVPISSTVYLSHAHAVRALQWGCWLTELSEVRALPPICTGMQIGVQIA